MLEIMIRYIIEEKLTAEDRERIHLFSTYFYDKLTQKNRKSDEPRTPTTMHGMVKSWTKNVDIFSKDFLFIPINESSHWYLVIVCYPRMVAEEAENNYSRETCLQTPEVVQSEESDMDEFDRPLLNTAKARSLTEEQNSQKSDDSEDDFNTSLCKAVKECEKKIAGDEKRRKSQEIPIKTRPCILIFDSLGSNHRATVMTNLRNYLNCEWKARKDNCSRIVFDKDSIKGSYPKVPFQENLSDCGLYVLQYFESFFKTPIEDYKFPLDLRSWFSQGDMVTKRVHITNVIRELQAKAESLKNR